MGAGDPPGWAEFMSLHRMRSWETRERVGAGSEAISAISRGPRDVESAKARRVRVCVCALREKKRLPCLSGPRDKTSMRDLVVSPAMWPISVSIHVGARCGVDARIAPPFMEATDASRLVCVVVVSYQEFSLSLAGAALQEGALELIARGDATSARDVCGSRALCGHGVARTAAARRSS